MADTFADKLESLANEAEEAAAHCVTRIDWQSHHLLRAQIYRQIAQVHRETFTPADVHPDTDFAVTVNIPPGATL